MISIMAPVTIPRSLRKVITQLVLGMLGSGVCLWITVIIVQASISEGWSLGAVIIVIVMVLVSTLSVLGVVGLLVLCRRPGLVIEDRGLTESTSLISIGFIPWEQAVGFIPGEFHAGHRRNRLVGIVFADPQWPWTQLRGLRRHANRFNRWLKMPPGVISVDTLRIGNVELAALLVEQRRLRRPDLPVAGGPVPGAQPGTWEISDPCGYLAALDQSPGA